MRNSLVLLLLFCIFASNVAAKSINTREDRQKQSTKNKIFPVIGADLSIANFAGGGIVRAGVAYQKSDIRIDTLLEYNYIKSRGLTFSGNRTHINSRIFPHLMITATRYWIDPFILIGAGYGWFKLNNFGEITRKEKPIIGFGFGAKYHKFVIALRFFSPEVSICQIDEFGSKTCFSSYNPHQITLGILFDI